jgi:hypothetical protein
MRYQAWLSLISITILFPAWSASHDRWDNELRDCSEIEQDSARLACFDRVMRAAAGKGVQQQEESAEVTMEDTPVLPAADVATDTSPTATLPEEIGLAPHDRKDQGKPDEYTARVVRCSEGASGKYFFYFENGQVWQESSASRRSYDNCDFLVAITKDTFGYRMSPKGETQRIRIRRVR